MLQCTDLVKSYRKKDAVHHLSLHLDAGKIYALLGPNGSGKTTLMKMIAGLVKPTSGEITFERNPIGTASKAHIAYMPTEAFFYSYMTGKDAGNYYRDFFDDFQPERYARYLEEMELDPNQKISKMSSGMMAKLKIALTLSRDARLIMLDEPLNGIDLITRERIIQTLTDSFRPDKTFVLSSHLVEELEKMIHYAFFIKQGELVLEGSLEELHRERGKTIVDLYKEIYA